MEQLGYPTTGAEMRNRLVAIVADNDYHTFVAELVNVPANATSSGLSHDQASVLDITELAQAKKGDEPRLVGMIGLRIGVLYEKNGLHGQIMALVVDEQYQGMGIGSLLVDRAEEWFRDHGVQSIVLGSGYHRPAAHQFYERVGFRATGKRFIKKL
jgi:GNAT superfamily N-acetyltransferase